MKKNKLLKKILHETDIAPLMNQIKEYDQYTFYHSICVANRCIFFVNQMNVGPPPHKDMIIKAAILHDVGKTSIPKDILDKKETLSKRELFFIRQHAFLGSQLLKKNKFPEELVDAVYKHHENLDGTGYYGFKDKEIPVMARIIRIIDSYGAMRDCRAYGRIKTRDEAVSSLLEGTGTVYDRDLLYLFIEYLNNIPEEEEDKWEKNLYVP